MAFNKEAKFSEQNLPEPPKDENGSPIAPPEGFKPPKPGCCCGEKPAEAEQTE